MAIINAQYIYYAFTRNRGDSMPDYKKIYLTMMGAAEDVIQLLEQTDPPSGDWSLSLRITKLLTDAQLQCEDIYINAD